MSLTISIAIAARSIVTSLREVIHHKRVSKGRLINLWEFLSLPSNCSCKGLAETCKERFGRIWRGTSASLALAVPTEGIYLPCHDIFHNYVEEFTS